MASSSILSERQMQELNKSLIQYLKPVLKDSDPALIDMLCHKLCSVKSATEFDKALNKTIPTNYLEKKWSTVLRLQKKVYDLESEISSQKELIETYSGLLSTTSSSSSLIKDKFNWIPTRLKSTLQYQQASITALAIHPFNPIIAAGSHDGTIAIWNLLDLTQPEKIIKNAHSRAITSLEFQPRNSKQPLNHTLKESDNTNLTSENQRNTNNIIKNISTITAPLLASSSSDLSIKLWNIDAPAASITIPVRQLTGHEHSISDLKFSTENPNILISCSRDKTIKMWDILSGWSLRTIIGHSDWVRSISINETNEYLVSCSNDQSIRLTHLESGKGIGLCVGHEQVIESVIFLPMSINSKIDRFLDEDICSSLNEDYQQVGYKYCVSCGRDNLIKFWLLPLPDLTTGKPLPGGNPRGLEIFTISNGHSSWIKALQMHPNGKYLASCSDDKLIKLWDLEKLKDGIAPISILKGSGNFVNCIKFPAPILPDDYDELLKSDDKLDITKAKRLLEDGIRCYLVSGSADNTIKVWV